MLNPNLLIGVEADLDWANLSASHDECIEPFRCAHTEHKGRWFGTVRGRLGYAQNNWLLFATGGVAWVNRRAVRTLTAAVNPAALGETDTVSGTDAGWTVGGGIEYGFAPNSSLNLEYRYMQVDTGGDFIYSVSAANVHIESTDHINTLRIGLNYHFN
jgi:outer membrane immunogenic protein